MPTRHVPRWAASLYNALLTLYPASFREEYEREMRRVFHNRWREEEGATRAGLLVAVVWGLVIDALTTAPRLHAEILVQDIRYSWRAIWTRRARASTLASVVTLAIGIGAVTTVASVTWAVLLATLPFREPQRVVRVWDTNLARDLTSFSSSVPNYASLRERTRLLSSVAAMRSAAVNLTGGGTPQHINALRASANLWQTLGLQPIAGRSFVAEEDLPGQARVVMISEGLWARRFGSDPGVIGRAVDIDGTPHVIVGVAPQDVGFATDVDIWLPLAPNLAEERRGDRQLGLVGRLAPGVTLSQATAELDSIAQALAREFPNDDEGWGLRLESAGDWIAPRTLRQRITVLAVAVLLLLLVACANVATLQMASATIRVREISVRLALGASRARVLRQMVTEGLALSALGGGLGVGLAWAMVRAADRWLPSSLPRVDAVTMNLPVLTIAVLAIVATVVGTGLLPAAVGARAGIALALSRGGRTSTGDSRQRVRHMLVGLQVALATMLAVSAALVSQSLMRLGQVPLGFDDPEHVLIARVSRDSATEEDQDRNLAFYDSVLRDVRGLPGVVDAGMTSEVPFGELDTQMPLRPIPRSPRVPESGVQASWRLIDDGFLRTMRIPTTRGRVFGPGHETEKWLVLSETLARSLWPDGEDPVGRRVAIGNGQLFTIIGVVGDVRQRELSESPTATMYWSASRFLWPTMTLVIRTSVDATSMISAVRAAVLHVDPAQPLFDLRTMASVVRANAAQPRFNAMLLLAFAGMALLLAATGIVGVVTCAAASHMPELAVRLALGSSPSGVVRHVMRGGLSVSTLGVAVGLSAALIAGRVISSFLFGVDPDDVLTFAAMGAALLGVALLACWVPAHRASRIDPAMVLRGD
jgi:predicted permease